MFEIRLDLELTNKEKEDMYKKMTILLSLIVLILLFFNACEKGPTPTITFSVSPDPLVIDVGQPGKDNEITVTVDVTLSGFGAGKITDARYRFYGITGVLLYEYSDPIKPPISIVGPGVPISRSKDFSYTLTDTEVIPFDGGRAEAAFFWSDGGMVASDSIAIDVINIDKATIDVTDLLKRVGVVAILPPITSSRASFVPDKMEINKGASITWVNLDLETHRVVGDKFDSGDMSLGDIFQYRFTVKGTFPYSDKYDSEIKGEITVK